MPDNRIDLTRRSVLASLGAVGAAGAGAGLGTSALFNDEESIEGNTLAAGELNLQVDWQEHYYNGLGDAAAIESLRLVDSPDDVLDGEVGLPDSNHPLVAVAQDDVQTFMEETTLETSGPVDDPEPGLIDLTDVKPGDFGEVTLSYHLSGNPAYVGLCAERVSSEEHGVTEPEASLGDDGPAGELGDHVQAVVWYDPNCNNLRDAGDGNVVDRGTLNEVLSALGADGGDCAILDPEQSGGASDPTHGGNCHAPDGGTGFACEETLYLIENVGNGSAGDGQTPAADDGPFLFEVALSGGDAVLSELTNLPDRITAGHIGATPDGEAIYVVDRDTGHLARYDVGTGTITDPGQIAGHPGGVVLVAFSPDGTLYMASNDDDTLYRVDSLDSSPTATEIGPTGIDVQGADIAFTADGTLFLYSNQSQSLYTVDPSTGAATLVGETGVQLTGLAVLGAGTGHLVGSATNPDDELIVIDRDDGGIVDDHPMTLGGDAYSYDFGDMTVGELCTDRPSGHCVALAWWLPRAVGNVVQSDRYVFEIGFRAEQCRNNDSPLTDGS